MRDHRVRVIYLRSGIGEVHGYVFDPDHRLDYLSTLNNDDTVWANEFELPDGLLQESDQALDTTEKVLAFCDQYDAAIEAAYR